MARLWTSRAGQSILAVLALASFMATLLDYRPFVRWAHDHGPWILTAAIIELLALWLSVGYLNERLGEAETQLAQRLRSHDTALFERLVDKLPPDKGVIRRLTGTFRAKSFAWEDIITLDQFKVDWEDDPSAHFTDSDLEAAKEALLAASREFLWELWPWKLVALSKPCKLQLEQKGWRRERR